MPHPVPAYAIAVHGLTTEFLADKPLFADVADELLASVDIAFLDAELKRAAKPPIATERVVDRWCSHGASIPAATIRSTTCADIVPPSNV